MTEATKAPERELFDPESVDGIITKIEGKGNQIGVMLDLVYPFFTSAEPGEKELFELHFAYSKIRTMLEIASEALTEINNLVERWNEVCRTIHAKSKK